MNKNYTKIILQLLAFLLLIGSTQLQYFLPLGRGPIVFFGMFVFIVQACLFFEKDTKFEIAELGIIGLMIYGLALTCILLTYELFIGAQTRYLPIFWVSQIFIFFILNNIIKNKKFTPLVLVISLILILEIVIILGQFSKNLGYAGFDKIVEVENDKHALTGSMTNPNDSAIFLMCLSLSLVYIYVFQNKKYKALAWSILVIPIFFIAGSRTVIVIAALNLIGILIWFFLRKDLDKWIKVGLSFAVFTLIFYLFNFLNLDQDTEGVALRAFERISRLEDALNDDSILFRFTVHQRLFDNIWNLGMGTFTDLKYGEFFLAVDDPLMKINPHSHLAEMSFLFGYFGLIYVVIFYLILLKSIIKDKYLGLPLKITFLLALLAMQAVSSSNMQAYYLYMPFIIILLVGLNRVFKK
jgi:hypothetical protein